MNKQPEDGLVDGSRRIQVAGNRRTRNAVVLPDGTKPVPMGSGKISGLLGTGGMANVYEIWNSQLEVARAVKLLHPNYTEDQKQRFQTEIKICAKLHHPNIVEIHAVGTWNGLPYIEMERIKGVTLENLLSERGALPVEVSTSIGILIGRALRHAHNQEYVIYGQTYHGVIHRDLKPSNIMLSKDGVVKLMDFGIARPTDASIHTTDGSILGTMQYLSPEQLDGKEPDLRADIYSLGTILYEIITGVKAFPENNISRLMLSKIRNEYKPLDKFEIRIPVKLRKLIHRCMVHDRVRRAQDAEAFLEEVEKVHRSVTNVTPEQVITGLMQARGTGKTVVVARRRAKLIPAIAVAAVLLAAGLGFIVFGTFDRKEPPAVTRISEPKLPREEPAVDDPPLQKPPPREPERVKKRRSIKQASIEQSLKSSGSSRRSSVSLPEPKPTAPESPLDKLRLRYATDDLLEILAKETQAGNYRSALMVYDSLPAQQASKPAAKLFKLRILDRLGRTGKLREFVTQNTIDDGEFYLAKAKVLYAQGSTQQSLRALDQSLNTASAILDHSTLRQEALYYKALCRSRLFDAEPDETALKRALDSWFEVKAALRTSPNHAYYRKAVSEMQRLRLPDQEGTG